MVQENLTDGPFSGKVRVRVCGILQENGKILLLKHHSIGPVGYLWSPPGGGVEFGESLEDALKKEFLEETNMVVDVCRYLFTHEFISAKFHAIELFFEVRRISGDLKLGFDPELTADQQILTDAKFFSSNELENLPPLAIHNAFNAANARDEIAELRGLITFMY